MIIFASFLWTYTGSPGYLACSDGTAPMWSKWACVSRIAAGGVAGRLDNLDCEGQPLCGECACVSDVRRHCDWRIVGRALVQRVRDDGCVVRVHVDGEGGELRLQGRHRADVVEVGVRQENRRGGEPVPVEHGADAVRVRAGVDYPSAAARAEQRAVDLVGPDFQRQPFHGVKYSKFRRACLAPLAPPLSVGVSAQGVSRRALRGELAPGGGLALSQSAKESFGARLDGARSRAWMAKTRTSAYATASRAGNCGTPSAGPLDFWGVF